MTQTFDLNKMGLSPLTTIEMSEIDGGNWLWDALRVIGVEKAVDYLIEHRQDIAGFLSYMAQNPIRPSEYR